MDYKDSKEMWVEAEYQYLLALENKANTFPSQSRDYVYAKAHLQARLADLEDRHTPEADQVLNKFYASSSIRPRSLQIP